MAQKKTVPPPKTHVRLRMNFCRCKCRRQYQLLCTLYRNDMKRSDYAHMIIHRFHIRLKKKEIWLKRGGMEHNTLNPKNGASSQCSEEQRLCLTNATTVCTEIMLSSEENYCICESFHSFITGRIFY